ncbi:Phosphatidyl-N-methylethanolamine N-methyltransferase [Diplodia seriata]|uniref:Phosphatidyl-N-methylethanolamine N-methyltransferase n=1 Tax=Diplodia seriata TaxID=420778 RepID=A0ABR3CKS0_9PEZI
MVFFPRYALSPHIEQYHNKVITKLFGGNSLYGCYGLAVTIFSLGIIRDIMYVRFSASTVAPAPPQPPQYGAQQQQQQHPIHLSPPHRTPPKTDQKRPGGTHSYKTALESQPELPLLTSPTFRATAYGLLLSGNVLVLSSMWALGVTGTYLGDYFGILMDDKVSSFPFSVTDAPMYWGSTCSFLGSAVLLARPAGLVLTALVYAAYSVALRYEDPFTAEIYARRERERAAAGGGGKKSL